MGTLIEGTYNTRDTGGTPLAAGGVTRAGVLYRADALSAVTDAGLAGLAASPVGVIVDLRTADERAAAPDRLPASRPFHQVNLSLMEGAITGLAGTDSPDAVRTLMHDAPTLPQLYIAMLRHGAPAFAAAARLIVAPPDPAHPGILAHCTAGKDRTGVLVALLLDAVGADRDAVIADYAETATNLSGSWSERMLSHMAARGLPLEPLVVALATASPPEAMVETLAWVDDQGGSAALLRDGGLDDAALATLRRRFVG